MEKMPVLPKVHPKANKQSQSGLKGTIRKFNDFVTQCITLSQETTTPPSSLAEQPRNQPSIMHPIPRSRPTLLFPATSSVTTTVSQSTTELPTPNTSTRLVCMQSSTLKPTIRELCYYAPVFPFPHPRLQLVLLGLPLPSPSCSSTKLKGEEGERKEEEDKEKRTLPRPRMRIPDLKEKPGAEPEQMNAEEDAEEEEEEDEELMTVKKHMKYEYTSAYMRRNVFKSVIRHMYCYIRKNRAEIIRVLKANHFTMHDIEHAFFKVNYFSDLERQKGYPKKSQATVNWILAKSSIYTFILRETLKAMICNWDSGRFGKISRQNLLVYRDVCETLYRESVRVLGQEAEGTTFAL